jgi:6-phosphofructokinase
MLGFLDGPHGIYSGSYVEIDDCMMDAYRNTGGFDMIGSGRHKIETPEEFAQSQQWCETLRLDGLVIIGGDDSNTNAAVLAEYFQKNVSLFRAMLRNVETPSFRVAPRT